MTYDLVLDALGDPTRRRILEALRGGPLTVGALAGTQMVSRPAVSQHLKVLEQAGLVLTHAQGNRRIVTIRNDALQELRAYLDGFWSDVLTAYSDEIKKQFGN